MDNFTPSTEIPGDFNAINQMRSLKNLNEEDFLKLAVSRILSNNYGNFNEYHQAVTHLEILLRDELRNDWPKYQKELTEAYTFIPTGKPDVELNYLKDTERFGVLYSKVKKKIPELVEGVI